MVCNIYYITSQNNALLFLRCSLAGSLLFFVMLVAESLMWFSMLTYSPNSRNFSSQVKHFQIVSSILSIDFITSSINWNSTFKKKNFLFLGVVWYFLVVYFVFFFYFVYNTGPPTIFLAHFHFPYFIFVVKCLLNNILKLLQYLLVIELVGNWVCSIPTYHTVWVNM